MLMHFANNTFALACGHIDVLKDAEGWTDVLPAAAYALLAAGAFLLTILTVLLFRKVADTEEGGNMDKTAPIFETYE